MTRLEKGFYSAEYFNKARAILSDYPPTQVKMQVFQREHSVLFGMEETVQILRTQTNGAPLKIKTLSNGMKIEPWETVMTIEGNLADFVHLESVYLGVLARGTRVATNMRKIVDAAKGKPVLFMGDRFDRYENQEQDGNAAIVGGASAVCTPAMTLDNGYPASGTMPHALIAAFGGDVVEACKAYHKKFPDEQITALVDFNNDCVTDALACLKEFGSRLGAVRLDTSGSLVDKSLKNTDDALLDWDSVKGVNDLLVRTVRKALNENNGKHVKIIVSGGFTAGKIKFFEEDGVPVDMYGVGSSIIKNGPDFTADVCFPVHKVGRPERPNPKLIKR